MIISDGEHFVGVFDTPGKRKSNPADSSSRNDYENSRNNFRRPVYVKYEFYTAMTLVALSGSEKTAVG